MFNPVGTPLVLFKGGSNHGSRLYMRLVGRIVSNCVYRDLFVPVTKMNGLIFFHFKRQSGFLTSNILLYLLAIRR
jgi:hypothetical protein